MGFYGCCLGATPLKGHRPGSERPDHPGSARADRWRSSSSCVEVDKVVANHDVLRVRRQDGGDFVVLGADDWRAIEETLFLYQVPGLVESIHEAAREPLTEATRVEDLDW
jgi:PHD/YefM family antitoxin component YafN of YafNO toxin-antitoxin module